MPDKIVTVTEPQQYKHYLLQNADEIVNVIWAVKNPIILLLDYAYMRISTTELNMQLLCLS